MTDVADRIIPTAEMAAVVGLSPRRLQQLEREDWISGRVARNAWNLSETVRSLQTHRLLASLHGMSAD